jgi:hypothetical protein
MEAEGPERLRLGVAEHGLGRHHDLGSGRFKAAIDFTFAKENVPWKRETDLIGLALYPRSTSTRVPSAEGIATRIHQAKEGFNLVYSEA